MTVSYSNLIFVDCEAFGGCPRTGRLTWFGAVAYASRVRFEGRILTPPEAGPVDCVVPPRVEIADEAYYELSKLHFVYFAAWLNTQIPDRPVFVSDNVAYDWQWINDGFHVALGHNPFGHSGRRISDFYAGLCGDFRNTQAWKRLRITPHDHNPVHDALGNAEAFERILAGER